MCLGEEGTTPTAYLQIGSWVYPLVPGVSPCYRTNYGAFILPDVHSTVQGNVLIKTLYYRLCVASNNYLHINF